MKAAYVTKNRQKNGWVYYIRATKEMLEHFPDTPNATESNKSDADAIVARWQGMLDTHTHEVEYSPVYAPQNSVHTLISAWKNSMAFKDNTESTKRNYRQIINRLLEWDFGDGKPFAEVCVSDVDYEYAEKIFQLVEDKITTNNARVTIIRLRSAWNHGKRLNLANNNPFSDLTLPQGHVRRVMWTPDQVKEMVEYCDAHGKVSMGTVITICYEWMQRPVDVRSLKWADIKPDGVGEFAQQKTGAEMRIPLTVGIQKRLELHNKHNSDDFIIREDHTLKPYTADRLTKIFSDLRNASGILPKVRDKGKRNPDESYVYTDVRLADLRRSGVTHGSECGCTHDELMAISGHKNINSLLVYSVITETNAHNALAKRGLDTVGFKKLGRQMKTYRSESQDIKHLQKIIADQARVINQLTGTPKNEL